MQSRVLLAFVTCALAALAAGPFANAAPGDFDLSFSGDGFVAIDLAPERMHGGLADLAIQGDGKIVAAGGAGRRFGLVRFLPNGALDTTFGGNGIVATSVGSGRAGATGMALQADGRIVAAGVTGGGKFALVRYRRNGTLDPTFGGDGIVTTDMTRWYDYATDVVIQPNGKIIAAGRASGKGGRFALVRYRPNGKLDPTFSNDGKQFLNFSKGYDIANSLVLQSNSEIVVAGGERTFDSAERGRFALARFNQDGTLDFAATTNFGDDQQFDRVDQAFAVAVQPDGKIVAVGDGVNWLELARYEADGDLDPTFDEDGRVATGVIPGGSLKSVAIQADGKIIAAGTEGDGFLLARYATDGAIDGTFGDAGFVQPGFGDFGFGSARAIVANALALQDDGRIVAGASLVDEDGASRFLVARFLAE